MHVRWNESLATGHEELDDLQLELFRRATQNGARVEWLDERQLAALESKAAPVAAQAACSAAASPCATSAPAVSIMIVPRSISSRQSTVGRSGAKTSASSTGGRRAGRHRREAGGDGRGGRWPP